MTSRCLHSASAWRPAATRSGHTRLLRHLHFVQSLEALQGGGLGRAAFELHEAFIHAASESQLVATSGDNAPNLLPGTREYLRTGPDKAFFSPGLWREADQLLDQSDVIHGHGFYVSTNWIFGSKARLRRKPLIYHPHGFFEPWILERSPWKKRIAHLLFENSNFKAARLWRALTGKEADQIKAQGIRAPIVVAPNGIRLDPFTDASIKPLPKGRRRLLFLGRLHPKKGIALLLKSWAALPRQRRDWELILAGPDENGHLAELKQVVREHGLNDCVSFPGVVTGAKKIALLKSADLFALTSYSEGFSVAILEAMACRVPVLASRPCNFPELAADGGGFECDPSPESVTRALDQALSADSVQLRQRGEAAFTLVKKRYTWEAISRTILDACEHHCR